MLMRKLIAVSTLVVLCCTYAQVANACENKYTYAALGSLEKEELDELKQQYRDTSIQINREKYLYLWDVQAILGFSGEQTKTASNGKVEDWIWIDSENCKRMIKASFRSGELVRIKSYGF